MNVAEEVSQDPSYLQDEWKGYYNAKIINQPKDYIDDLKGRYKKRLPEYYGSKFLEQYNKLDLTPNSHFEGIPISLNASTVHVPTSVFDGGKRTDLLVSERTNKSCFKALVDSLG